MGHGLRPVKVFLRSAAIGCACAAVLAISAATALGAFEASPVSGSGSATATGQGIDGPFTSTLTTSFSPAHIQPGDPFTYTGKMQADIQAVPPGGCTAGAPQTTPYNSWFFSKVAPGTDYITEGSTGQANVAVSFTNTEFYEYFCPDHYRFTSGPMTVTVPGSQTQNMDPGCYQSTVFEAGIYFPQNPSGQQSFESLSGTLGTLEVGNGQNCAQAGGGSPSGRAKEPDVGDTACYRLNDSFDGTKNFTFGAKSPYAAWKRLAIRQAFSVYVKGTVEDIDLTPFVKKKLNVDKFVLAGAQDATVGKNPAGVKLYLDSYLTASQRAAIFKISPPFKISVTLTNPTRTAHHSSGSTNSTHINFKSYKTPNPIAGKRGLGVFDTKLTLEVAVKLGANSEPVQASSKATIHDLVSVKTGDSNPDGDKIKCSEVEWNN